METIIHEKLTAAFQPLLLDIEDESAKHARHAGAQHSATPGKNTHFRIKIISEAFTALSRLERTRQVHEVLKEELASQIHALSLTLRAPDEAV